MELGHPAALIRRHGERAYSLLLARYESAMMRRRFGFPREAGGVVALSEVGADGAGRHDYSASPWGTLSRVLPRSEVTSQDVFLDLGCGMGHMLLEAASYDFARAIGVEIAPSFADVARETIERNRDRLRCRDIEVVTADVVSFEIPDDVTIAYFSNPLDPPLARQVLANIAESVKRAPRRLRIVYFDPPDDLDIDAVDDVRFVRYGRRPLRRWRPAEYLRLYELDPTLTGG